MTKLRKKLQLYADIPVSSENDHNENNKIMWIYDIMTSSRPVSISRDENIATI